ncbi:ABC transporter substrate-binding protein [Marinibacterium sp. SX1]|uniref:ABC transporter substrate-binding protein n=1 Tax=Marinibacterium sp. SX1 TaxID=3388424 RepID=UPI003D186837
MTRLIALICLCLMPLTAPALAQEATATFGQGDTPMLVRSTTDIRILRPVLDRFAALNPDLAITYEQWGSNPLFDLSRAACRGQGQPADAVLSSAVQHLVWLVNAACARRYRSPATAALPAARRWRDELWGVTTEPAVIAYNTAAISGEDIPRDRFALLDAMRSRPEFYRGRIATYDISASGLGYLFAFSDSLEATTFGSMLEGLARVDAVATCCSTEIISGVAEGRFVMAYNVLGSYIGANPPPGLGMVLPEDYTLILSRGFMIPDNAPNGEAGIRLLEFLLGSEARGLLAAAGLLSSFDRAESGLAASSRRFISLSPALLVALDTNRRTSLFDLWSTAFQNVAAP